ncbi:MAG: hypothetical protein IT162_18790 [Bryobacterales bacterium]|nr:hypothetical protein [Bryobacterales bacterium]
MTELLRALESFASACREPALIEPGLTPLRLVPGQYEWTLAGARVLIEAWDEDQRLTRRIRAIRQQRPGRLTLEVEHFGKRTGTLELVDQARPAAVEPARRAARLALRERFGRFLARQFPGWTLEGLSTEADLEHSLSPAYPRALLRRGASAWAALAAPDELTAADHALTFGLIWFDYLRLREQHRLRLEGLCLLLPHGKAVTTCLRARWLNPHALQLALFTYAPRQPDWEEPLDAAQHGNLDTRIEPAAHAALPRYRPPGQPEARLEALVRADPSVFDAALLAVPVYGQVPALAGGERGVIDLLAATRAGRLAVIELKASADLHLPLQALDYWLRVRWHHAAGDFAAHGYFPSLSLDPAPPRLLLIAPALQFHPTTESILRYFDPAIAVTRIGLAVEWHKDLRVMMRLEAAHSPA